MNHRIAFLLVFAAVGGLGVSGVACSSSSSGNFGGDDSGTGDDATSGDGSSHDGGGDTLLGNDGGSHDGGNADAAGNCSPVNGPACDIVKQNCTTGKECVVVQGTDGGFTTACNATTVNEHIQKGEACSTQSPNPCLPGLECFEGRCTPHCCQGDDSVCGMSSDGIQGACDLNITAGGGNSPLFMVCTYKAVCKPFKVVPCPTGQACTVEDNLGTADCLGDNGKAEGASCMYKNDCVDGLGCFSAPDAGGICQMYCITPGQTPPFDAGTPGPGTGGCNSGKSCIGRLNAQQFPAWLSICQ
jgi:hypothetical protein